VVELLFDWLSPLQKSRRRLQAENLVFRHHVNVLGWRSPGRGAYRGSNPVALMMQSAQDRQVDNAPKGLNDARHEADVRPCRSILRPELRRTWMNRCRHTPAGGAKPTRARNDMSGPRPAPRYRHPKPIGQRPATSLRQAAGRDYDSWPPRRTECLPAWLSCGKRCRFTPTCMFRCLGASGFDPNHASARGGMIDRGGNRTASRLIHLNVKRPE
jgi:hypothetical protein